MQFHHVEELSLEYFDVMTFHRIFVEISFFIWNTTQLSSGIRG